MPRLLPCLLAPLLLSQTLLAPASAGAQTRTYEIQPSSIDPNVHNFDTPNVVIPNATVSRPPMVLFLSGTGGKPTSTTEFLKFIAAQGYQVIGLTYDDTPTAEQLCPSNPDPDCAEAFRRMHVEGDIDDGHGKSPVATPVNETIALRLNVLLHNLTLDKPEEGWDYYLDGDRIRWERIVVSGQAQGAGMAAYIAKHHEVARVVLFSSPWDTTGPDNQPAAWLAEPSATPMDRWYAEYHQRELTAGLIKGAYATLQIPADHIHVLTQDLPSNFHGNSPNPFQINTIRDVRYAPDWQAMFGRAAPNGTVN